MDSKENELSRECIGEELLIGFRKDETLFWLRKENEKKDYRENKFEVKEGGTAWIDKDSDTTILDLPTNNQDVLHKLKIEFCNSDKLISDYIKTNHFVELSKCNPKQPLNMCGIGYICEIKNNCIDEGTEGYILNEDTYIRKNNASGELFYSKLSDYSLVDIEEDRFGWIKAAIEYSGAESTLDLLRWLRGFKKESYGRAWINSEHNILVLGPTLSEQPDIIDSFFAERLERYFTTYRIWNQTNSWIECESMRVNNPIDYKVNIFHILLKYAV